MASTTAAIAGAAQVIQRPGDWQDPADARGPIELMVDAARAAADDAGAPSLLSKVGWVAVAGGWWRHRNPGQLVAERIGAPGAATALTPISGSAPQELVAVAAERIAAGDLDVALVLGGEARWSHRRLKRAGETPRWTDDPGTGTPEPLSGFPDDMLDEARVFGAAATAYALLDDRRRVAAGDTMEEHRTNVAELWSGFGAVAAGNPFAWDRSAPSTEQIREPSPSNRMISFPYTKAMVANNTVDMASAILLCSVDVAVAAGVSLDRLVFPHSATTSHETWLVVERDELHRTPALAAAGRVALDNAGIGIDDVEHVDLYACFPAIVRMSAEALGLSLDRPLTVTGGLGFAGAPVGNAAGQSIAAIVPRVRDGGWGLVHGNGGNATKHAFGIYANHPPDRFVRADSQHLVHDRPRGVLDDGWHGAATIEAATVVFDRDGPTHVFAAVRSDDGRRGWATSRDEALIGDALAGGVTGDEIERDAGGELVRASHRL
jgi:acetyl-CoA C-acetyltransferase